jgi:hypothetical protein
LKSAEFFGLEDGPVGRIHESHQTDHKEEALINALRKAVPGLEFAAGALHLFVQVMVLAKQGDARVRGCGGCIGSATPTLRAIRLFWI